MSRFALEWAKLQPVAPPADKLVLVILGDHAGGLTHSTTFLLTDFAKTVGMTAAQVVRTFGRLQRAEVLAFAQRDSELGRKVEVSLNIPAKWRRASAPGDGGPINVPTAVYRLYCSAGRLLYVGISDDPPYRFRQHKDSKPWWWEVVTREIVWHPTRHLAKAEEDLAIATEDPVHNGRDYGLIERPAPRRPKLRYAHDVSGPERYAAFKERLIEALAAHKLDAEQRLLMPIPEIAKYFDIEAAFVIKALEEVREKAHLRWYEEGSIYVRERWY